MTDITELAQILKAAAEKWQEAWGKYDKVEITIAEFIRAANQYESIVKDPANILALVEALEKAQQRIGKLEKKLTDHKRMNQEMAKAMLTPNDSDAAGMEIAALRQRIAELESRTVKLPDLRQIVSGDRYVWSDGVYNYSQDVKVALAAAGIKVEAD
ncbi:ead/Ea22-like family protein [Klebsiella quasipneumoniae subsp. similipneumoniae]